ncbi:pleckstrin homology domain-containing family N member 1 isoform X2 [Takifugu flavidus]|uniref:pleckstrin homology domain-containing family N member 1 isoform X2 n=1 Tax=Takifugu flavidus TaxID=433684 RepID=UPI00254480B4|nr:pleckstrin homology domain-containing family N member 1 isoform X2 [Takifugu flavidus]
MGCCSVTQRHTGVDEVGPDEIELLELSGDNLGVWSLAETRCPQVSLRKGREEQRPPLPPPPPPPPHCASVKHLGKEVVLWGRSKDELHQRIYSQTPPRNWEGQAPHMYGEIIHSSLVLLYNSHTQGSHEHFLVLFSFHLLILSLDHSKQDFIYEGILPLSGLSFQPVSLDHSVSHSPHVFETSSPMMESKVFICPSAAELQQWLQHLKDRRYKSMTRPMSPSQCALSYLLPCDEHWKREELKTYLMQAPIWQWEGSPIQHMGQPGYLSMVHIINTQNQGLQERLMVLFPHDVLLLSIDSKVLNIRYEGRLPRHSIKAVERSALPGQMEFELIGELLEPLLISCAHQEDYWSWIFQLQQIETATLL